MLTWQPSATLENIRQRASIIAKIREFFTNRGYLEVETPIMAQFGVTDCYLSNIQAIFRQQSYALQTSPEYHMKRLLAAGSGPIFQLARVFRDDELGRWHNPEFTLLEWYQLEIDHLTLLKEVEALFQLLLDCPAFIVKTYRQAFEEICGFNPLTADLQCLRKVVQKFALDNVLPLEETRHDQYLFLLMSHVVEPAFADNPAPIALIDFPASQASLAQITNGVAQRFEVYYRGLEIANGFHELTDAALQHERFKQDLLQREQLGLSQIEVDPYLLAALAHGMPACSGVALGIDRLIALVLNQPRLTDVLSFDFSRA